MPVKRLIIVEDQTAIRDMLVEILRYDPLFQVVGVAEDGETAVELCRDVRPDVCVLDAKLPRVDGAEFLRRVRHQLPDMRVLVFSGYENGALVREMIEAGAHGFVEKTAGLGEFKKGLEAVARGGSYFGPAVASLLRKVIASPLARHALNALTPRERQVLDLLNAGQDSKEIATQLGITPKTVDNYRATLIRKLDAHENTVLNPPSRPRARGLQKNSPQRGSALLVALMFSAILAIALTSYLKLSLSAGKLANRSFYFNAAQNLVDTGIERALWCLNNEYLYASPSNWTTYGGFSPRSGYANEYQGTFPSSGTYFTLAGNCKGQVKVWVGDYDATSQIWHAVAQATVTLGDGTTVVKVAETYLQQRSFAEKGLVARNGMSFNGNVMMDSWKSRPTTSDDIPYSTSVRRTEATIASPALISVQNADIYGFVAIGSSTIDSTGITVGAQGRVAGSFSAGPGIDTTRVTCDFTASFPDVNPASAGLSIAPITSNTSLSSGTYSASSIALSGNNQDLHIGSSSGPTADVTLTVNGNVTLSGGAKIYIYPGSTLKLYVSGDITMTGTSGVQNGTTTAPNNPDCFMLLGLRTEAQIAAGALMQDWTIRGTSYLSCMVFAPNADIDVNGTGDTYGSVLGNRVDMVGSGNFHQDESLGNKRITGLWKLCKWRELLTQSDRAAYANQLSF